MNNKVFSERLNRELDIIGVPQHNTERVEVFSKLMKIPRFKAGALLNGSFPPDPNLLESLANELEVSVEWLRGDTTRKH